MCNYDGPLQLFVNDTAGAGNWLRISFDTSTNGLIAPDGIGTRVVATAGGQSRIRYLTADPSYLATSEPVVHFGLGAATQLDELRIEWSRGYVTVLTSVAVNRHLVITAPRPGDLNSDGVIGVVDLLALLGQWGPVSGSASLAADLDNDGTVGVTDLLAQLGGWGGKNSHKP